MSRALALARNLVAIALCCAPAAPALAQDAPVNQTFVFRPPYPVKAVSVVGTFNGWDKTANPLRADADGATWRTSVPLRYGKYVYKFAQFTLDGAEKWVTDPNAPLDETDKINDNSVLTVTPAGYQVPASPNDGVTAVAALFHANGDRDLSYDNGQLTLTLRARPNDLSQIKVIVAGQSYPMKLVERDDLFAHYGANVPWNKKKDLSYNFELTDGKVVRRFGANGLQNSVIPFIITARNFRPYLLTTAPAPLKMMGPLTTQFVAGPAWARNLPIYEVNLDLYKYPKGQALREFEQQLPELKDLGAGILWFMPLHPRGVEKAFGSPYAVRDYAEINPDFGTKADFKHLVARAHQLGLRVLMDWVPNHTSWDNAWVKEHPEFYVKGADGKITQAFSWADVAQLDYGKTGAWNRPLWNVMRDDMALWVRDFDVDGFRADVAGSNGKVPLEFWNWLRPQLSVIKPVFMLAEADNAGVHPAFDMSYDWAMPPILWDIVAGRRAATAIDEQLRKEARTYPVGAVLMRFLDNHDWHPHTDWGWGNGAPVEAKPGMPQVAPLMVLCATLPGKPLLYNGQELSFSKTDPSSQIGARAQAPVYSFYRNLLELYQNNAALSGGSFAKISTDNDAVIYAFTRQSGANRVVVVVNLSETAQTVTLRNDALAGPYTDAFANAKVSLNASPTLKLAPWDYRIYVAR